MWARAVFEWLAVILGSRLPKWYDASTFSGVADAIVGHRVRSKIGHRGEAVAGVLSSAAIEVQQVIRGGASSALNADFAANAATSDGAALAAAESDVNKPGEGAD